MTNEERTKQFVSKINQDAKQLEVEISEKTENEINSLYKKGAAEIDSAVQLHIGRENEKTLKESSLEINARRSAIKQEIIAKRNEICESIFSEVMHEVKAYAKTDEYRKAVSEMLAKINKEYGKIEKLNIAEGDKALFAEICETEASVSTEIKLGGFEAYVSGGTRFIDATLDTRFHNENAAFLSKGQLIIR